MYAFVRVSPHEKYHQDTPTLQSWPHIIFFLYGPLKDNWQWQHYMENEEIAEHCVPVAAEEE